MGKPLGDFKKGGGKGVLPDDNGQPRAYKLRVVEYKVVENTTSGYPFVVADVVVVNPCPQQGMHTELGFSMSPNAEGMAQPWLLALGLGEDDYVPTEPEEVDALRALLNKKCLRALIKVNLIKTTDQSGKYPKNEISPPWEIESAMPENTDFGDSAPQGERPPF